MGGRARAQKYGEAPASERDGYAMHAGQLVDGCITGDKWARQRADEGWRGGWVVDGRAGERRQAGVVPLLPIPLALNHHHTHHTHHTRMRDSGQLIADSC